MSRKLSAGLGRGQRKSCNSHSAELLACMIGVSGLRYLTDEETAELAEFMVYLINTGYEDGFHAGLAEMRSYNADVTRLVHAAPSTEH